MNDEHLRYLASDEWAQRLERELLPWIAGFGDLGADVLEVGPGPGLTTDILRTRAARVTAIELDAHLAAGLGARLAGTNVDVVHGDAAATGLASDRFTSVACFSMLHHVPTVDEQDALLVELCRVLRPGGGLVGVDAVDQPLLREHHHDDVYNPIPLDDLPARLAGAGFTDVVVEPGEWEVRFQARKPADGVARPAS